MVGKTGFEPATPWSQTKCTTKLCYFPLLLARPVGVEPATFWSVVKRSIQLSYGRLLIFKHLWWLRAESNHRHEDFQSSALPTELRSHLAVPTRIELAIFCVTGRRDNRYTTGPFGCGSRIWTYGLRVMSPTSYQTAPFRDIIFGGERGIRTPAPFPTCRFSRPIPSTRLGYFSFLVPKAGLEPARDLTPAGF